MPLNFADILEVLGKPNLTFGFIGPLKPIEPPTTADILNSLEALYNAISSSLTMHTKISNDLRDALGNAEAILMTVIPTWEPTIDEDAPLAQFQFTDTVSDPLKHLEPKE